MTTIERETKVEPEADRETLGSQTLLESNVPQALAPVLEHAYGLFTDLRNAHAAGVDPKAWTNSEPVCTFNPRQTAPVALVTRRDDNGNPVGVWTRDGWHHARPELSFGPSFLTLTNHTDVFKALAMAYFDFANQFGASYARVELNVDRNGYVRNRSAKKARTFVERVMGCRLVEGTSGRDKANMVAILPPDPSRAWADTTPEYATAQAVRDMVERGCNIPEMFAGLERYADEKGNPKAKSDPQNRTWFCACVTNRKAVAEGEAKRFKQIRATKTVWLPFECGECNTMLRPVSTMGAEITDKDGQFVLCGDTGQETLRNAVNNPEEQARLKGFMAEADKLSADKKTIKQTTKALSSKVEDMLRKNPGMSMLDIARAIAETEENNA